MLAQGPEDPEAQALLIRALEDQRPRGHGAGRGRRLWRFGTTLARRHAVVRRWQGAVALGDAAPDPPMRHHRDRQRELAAQEPHLIHPTAAPPGPLAPPPATPGRAGQAQQSTSAGDPCCTPIRGSFPKPIDTHLRGPAASFRSKVVVLPMPKQPMEEALLSFTTCGAGSRTRDADGENF